MSMRAFIRTNRDELRRLIRQACPNVGALPEEAMREWIMNDEGLYMWAKSEGVKL